MSGVVWSTAERPCIIGGTTISHIAVLPTSALQHNRCNCHRVEVHTLLNLHRLQFCLPGWCLALRRQLSQSATRIKTMRLRNLPLSIPRAALPGWNLSMKRQLSHLRLGRGDLPLRYQRSIHKSANVDALWKRPFFASSYHWNLSLCDLRSIHTSIKIQASAETSTVFCIVWMVGPLVLKHHCEVDDNVVDCGKPRSDSLTLATWK